MKDMCEWHNPKGGKKWRVVEQGIEVERDGVTRTAGEPISVQYLWEQFGDFIKQASWEYGVPADIVAAMIPVESDRADDNRFDPQSLRKEPGYISDRDTPHLVSPGVMQTLISTARDTAARHGIVDPSEVDRELLFDPFYSIMIGTAYLADLSARYGPDPVLMCAAYNAGGVYRSRKNEWRIRAYSGSRIDWYVKWFNDFRAASRQGIIDLTGGVSLTGPC